MVEAKNNRDIAFSKVVQRTVILGIIIGIVIGGAIISFVPTNQSEGLSVQQGPERVGELEQSVEHIPYTASNVTRILEATDFTRTPIVNFRGYGQEIYVDHLDSGFRVSGRYYGLMIETYFHVIVDEYEKSNITIDISEVQGYGNIYLSMDYLDQSFWSEVDIELVDGQSGEITIEEELDFLQDYSDYSILEIHLGLFIRQESPGSITMNGIYVDVESATPIYPMRVQFNDQTGIDIFDNRYSDFLNYYPIMNLTEDSLIHSENQQKGIVTGRANNGVVYLPVGNYTFDYGWGPVDNSNFIDSISVEVLSDMSTVVEVGLETIRLFIDIVQNQPADVWIEDNTIRYVFYKSDDLLPSDFFIYLPADLGQVGISIGSSITPNADDYEITLDLEGTSDYTIQASFPIFSFLIFGFNSGQLLLAIIVIGAIIASVISLQRLFDKQPIRNIASHKEFIPFIIAVLGNLAPWFLHDEMKFENGIWSYTFEWINLPTGLVFRGGTDRLVTIVSMEYLHVYTVQWFYWFIIIIIALRVLNFWHSESELGLYAPYIVLAFFGASATGITSIGEVSIGPFLLFLSLLVMMLFQSKHGERLTKMLTRNGE
ncbi:MAG: hypothetical protein RTV31_08115 [Candidatus Thorarchaeota archaeon]